MELKFKDAKKVSTATVVSLGLVGGWLTARESGIRPLGAIPLTAAAAYATRSWKAKRGTGVAAGLLGSYLAAFILSHPLAKKIGGYPSVIVSTSAVAFLAWLLSDRQN